MEERQEEEERQGERKKRRTLGRVRGRGEEGACASGRNGETDRVTNIVVVSVMVLLAREKTLYLFPARIS